MMTHLNDTSTSAEIAMHTREQAARDAMGRAYQLDLDGGTLARCTRGNDRMSPARAMAFQVVAALTLWALLIWGTIALLERGQPEIVLHPDTLDQIKTIF